MILFPFLIEPDVLYYLLLNEEKEYAHFLLSRFLNLSPLNDNVRYTFPQKLALKYYNTEYLEGGRKGAHQSRNLKKEKRKYNFKTFCSTVILLCVNKCFSLKVCVNHNSNHIIPSVLFLPPFLQFLLF